jgi:NADPH2:quinone reductase
VQFASMLGAARVVATVSTPAKADLARAAGADDVVFYKSEPLARRVAELTDGAGVDRVIELDFAANAEADAAMLRTGGEWVVYGSGAPQMTVPFYPLIVKNVSVHFFIVYNLSPCDRERAVATLARLLRRGALQHNVAARVPLADIARAHEMVERGEAAGNVVVQVA